MYVASSSFLLASFDSVADSVLVWFWQYILHIYTPDGRHLTTFTPYSRLNHLPSTSLTSKFLKSSKLPSTSTFNDLEKEKEKEKEKTDLIKGKESELKREERSTETWNGLGIRFVSWEKSGAWIAVGGWDGKVSFPLFSLFRRRAYFILFFWMRRLGYWLRLIGWQ